MNEEMLLYIKHEQLTIDTGLLKKSMNKELVSDLETFPKSLATFILAVYLQ